MGPFLIYNKYPLGNGTRPNSLSLCTSNKVFLMFIRSFCRTTIRTIPVRGFVHKPRHVLQRWHATAASSFAKRVSCCIVSFRDKTVHTKIWHWKAWPYFIVSCRGRRTHRYSYLLGRSPSFPLRSWVFLVGTLKRFLSFIKLIRNKQLSS